MTEVREYERALGERFIEGLPPGVTLYGAPTMDGRVPTFLFNVEGVPAGDVAQRLAERDIGVWSADNWYCVALAPRLPEQSVRAGIAHYNTEAELERLLDELQALSSSAAS
jgi:selenocysteine lyase/cysteine desulfurase